MYVAGNGLPFPGGTVEPAACDASSAAAGWSALSVRQKFPAFGPAGPAVFAVPSSR